MQANLETLSSLERRLSVTLPLDTVNTEVASRLKRLASTVKLHGFRPGKVPMKIVEQQFGGQVRQEVLGDAVQRSFGEAVKDRLPVLMALSFSNDESFEQLDCVAFSEYADIDHPVVLFNRELLRGQ